MARLSYLILSSFIVLRSYAASAVIDLIPDNFDKVVLKSGKPALVEFFAPWCGHCKNLAPVYEQLAQEYAFAEDKLVIAKVDADDHKSLGRKFGVQGFPTLKWFDGKSSEPEDYKGGRDLESLSSFITEKTGIKPKSKKAPPSKVQMLDEKSFKTTVGGEKDVLVAFTAPWCGHCKKLAPTWETLAQDFAAEPTVVIAKVDAEAPNSKSVAEEQGVSSYPTIKYFPKGSSIPMIYEGGRNEQDFINFINENAGTHRAPGGGLTAQGGTIAAIDAVVQKVHSAGGSFSDGIEDAKKAIQGLQERYADYYIKIFEKMSLNRGYAEKELKRLEGLLKKGGLAPEKRDDLTARSNILRKFRSTVVKDEL